MAKVSGWVEVRAEVCLDKVVPNPSRWDVRRPSPTLLTMVNRKTGLSLFVQDHRIRARFEGNPRNERTVEQVIRVAKGVLGVRHAIDPASAVLWCCSITVYPKTFRRSLSFSDQSIIADFFPLYEIFQKDHGRAKMVADDHVIYCGGSNRKTLSLWPDDCKVRVADLPQLIAFANHAAATLDVIKFPK